MKLYCIVLWYKKRSSSLLASWTRDRSGACTSRFTAGNSRRADTLVAQLWDTAQSIANDKLIGEREALAAARTNMDMEMADMAEVVATLESEQVDMAEQAERLEAKIKELQAQRDGLQSELAQSRTECTHLNDKLIDREKHTEELEKLWVSLQTRIRAWQQRLHA